MGCRFQAAASLRSTRTVAAGLYSSQRHGMQPASRSQLWQWASSSLELQRVFQQTQLAGTVHWHPRRTFGTASR